MSTAAVRRRRRGGGARQDSCVGRRRARRAAADAEAAEAEAAALRTESDKLSDLLKKLGSAGLSLQGERTALRQALSDAAARGPELEEQKRLAVAARAFKDAGRLAAELKGLAAEEETRRARVGELDREIAVNRVEVAAAEGCVRTLRASKARSGRGRRGVRARSSLAAEARRRRAQGGARGGGGGGEGGGGGGSGRRRAAARAEAAEAVELLEAELEALRQRVAALVGEAGDDAGSEAEAEAGRVTEADDDDDDDDSWEQLEWGDGYATDEEQPAAEAEADPAAEAEAEPATTKEAADEAATAEGGGDAGDDTASPAAHAPDEPASEEAPAAKPEAEEAPAADEGLLRSPAGDALEAEVAGLAARVAELNSQIDAAVEAEDYDAADALEAALKDADARLREARAALDE